MPEMLNAGEILINNYDDIKIDGLDIHLKPYQAVVFEKA